ncbi:flagellar basal body-associated protein FliL [Halochromatium salexigens]|uniref:Flagellar protein FliL n=1 Tax=Halochromatium salexigens TaxID=49447 RepID=A0AAJ0XFL0_HALSE|nr:flagellar basal body-associated protein FliL [Halochromatium salexigens]
MANSKGGSKNLLWLMVGLVVLSVGVAGVAVYLAWQSSNNAPAEGEKAATPRRSPIFVEVEPFTINMTNSRGTSRLLYIGMTFKVSDKETRDILKDHLPQVRSRLLMRISDEPVDELTDTEGKKQLADKLIVALQDPPLTEQQPELNIEEVLFTEFIVQ